MERQILITGAGGFIGSHLVDACLKRGDKVRAFVHYNSSNNPGWLSETKSHDRLSIVSGDIRDWDSVSHAVEGCTEIFHLAALIGIPYSYRSPLAYIRTNVEGTYNVLEAARIMGAQNVIVTSTSETFGSAQYVPIDEGHPASAQSPYAATKIAADQLAWSYHRSFNMPVKIVRPFNTFGPRQSARAIIPTIILQILAGRTHVSLGNLEAVRDLTYVADTVDAILSVTRSTIPHGTVTNIGMNEEISVGALATRIAGLMNARIQIHEDPDRFRPEQSEVARLRCDNTRLRTLTGWKPAFDLDAGLTSTIAWFKEHAHQYAHDAYVI